MYVYIYKQTYIYIYIHMYNAALRRPVVVGAGLAEDFMFVTPGLR